MGWRKMGRLPAAPAPKGDDRHEAHAEERGARLRDGIRLKGDCRKAVSDRIRLSARTERGPRGQRGLICDQKILRVALGVIVEIARGRRPEQSAPGIRRRAGARKHAPRIEAIEREGVGLAVLPVEGIDEEMRGSAAVGRRGKIQHCR